ncbi:MAG TPA: flagellin [Phycisphaerales bacterium]|nr:flagellin [Phycisphaerales bacterium]
MSRINSNIPSLVARSNLRKANDDLQTRLERLSTGLRINRGADDPAGLIVSNRIGSEISGLNQAVKNSERASSVISTAEGALNEAAELLNSIKGLVVEASNTGAISDEERAANQLQIDSAIDSVTRISDSASFGGLKLLNGSLDYVISGLRTSAITRAQVLNANMTNRTNLQVNVETIASAQTGRLYLRGDTLPSAGSPGFTHLPSSVRVEVAGPRGVRTIEFISGARMSAIVAAVNNVKDATGVSANIYGTTSGVVFNSMDFGSDEFVSVKPLGSAGGVTSFNTYKFPDANPVVTPVVWASMTAASRDAGRDVVALVNGSLGTGDGLRVRLPDSTNLGLDLTLNVDLATDPGDTSSFNITGGGALYQLGGDINSSQQINIGLPSIAASRIGGTLIRQSNGTLKMQFLESVKSGGANDLRSGGFQNASDIIIAAIDEISVIRGRLGALERNTLDTNVRSIQAAIENLTSSQSTIRDADFAAETAALTRAQILNQASTSVVQLANQQSQSVLALLQR